MKTLTNLIRRLRRNERARGDYITLLDRAVRAKLLTHESVAARQNQVMPHCQPHKRPGVIRLNGRPACELCMAAGARLRSDAEMRQPFAERSIDFDAARKYLTDYVEVPR